MNSTEFIRMSLERSTQATLGLLEDMKDAPLTFPTPNGGNHPLWVAGHLAWGDGEIIQHVMLGRPNPLESWKELFGNASEPVSDARVYPPYFDTIEAFKRLRGETLEILGTLSDADLDLPSQGCPAEYQKHLGVYAQCFMIALFNTLTHRGQVADARRAAGRKRMGV
jgi:hypothetical protein